MTLLSKPKPKIHDMKINNRIKFSEKDPKLSLMIKRRGLSKFAIKNYNTVFNEILILSWFFAINANIGLPFVLPHLTIL